MILTFFFPLILCILSNYEVDIDYYQNRELNTMQINYCHNYQITIIYISKNTILIFFPYKNLFFYITLFFLIKYKY